MRDSARLGAIEDYTSKYKGEQVEVALFGGDYQDGVLTAYCLLDDVAHLELNGHILIPLQNIASLHCSSRCDAPEPDWPSTVPAYVVLSSPSPRTRGCPGGCGRETPFAGALSNAPEDVR